MSSVKLIRFLSQLNKTKLNRFRDFVHSPFFNKNKDIKEFVDFLVAQKKLSSIDKIEPKEYSTIFSRPDIHKINLSHLQNKTIQLFYDFLAQEGFAKQDAYKQLLRLEEGSLLGDSQLIDILLQKTDIEINDESEIIDYFIAASSLKTAESIRWLEKGVVSIENHQKAIEYIDIMYILSQLKLYAAVLSLKSYRYQTIEGIADSNFIALLKKYEDVPIVKASTLGFLLMMKKEEQHYVELRKLVSEKIDSFSGKIILFLISALLRHLVKKYNYSDDNSTFLIEAAKLYDLLIVKRVYFQIGKIDRIDYSNIIGTLLYHKEFDKALSFAKEYKVLLNASIRDCTYHLFLGEIAFVRGDLDKAENILLNTNCPKGSSHVAKQHLLVRIYYEDLKWDLLLSTLERLRIYVSRNTTKQSDISSEKKIGISNFINITKKMVKLHYRLKDELSLEIKKIEQKMKETKIIWKRKWISSKLEVWKGKTKA